MEKQDQIKIISALFWPLVFVSIMWGVWGMMRPEWTVYGILPQTFSGLKGILFSPFLHDPRDIHHILNNSLPFLFMGWALFYFYRSMAWKVLLGIWFLEGFWVWLSVSDVAYHIGASGILYGLAAFLFTSGVIRKQTNLMGLTLLIVFLYGGMIWGIFPYDVTISWQSHLFGSIAGILLAYRFRKEGWQRTKYEWEDEPVQDDFSALRERHENVISGKIPDPNLEEEKNESPSITIHYEYSENKKVRE